MVTSERLNEIGYYLIQESEHELGKMEQNLFYGFEFCDNVPQLMGNRKDGFTIYIGNLAKENEDEAIFQISHEVLHLMSPCSFDEVSVFEEGLATYYSIYCLKKIGQNELAERNLNHLKSNHPKYYSAYEMVLNNNLFHTFKKIREKYPTKLFSKITSDELKEFIVGEELKKQLTEKFNKK